MAVTNFGKLTNEELTVWSRDLWKAERNVSFLSNFTGSGPSSMIQRITELKKGKNGARAVITLVHDLEGDGVVGDRQLEGNEEAMSSSDQVVNIDQMRHANRHEGEMADQRSVVTFRNNSMDVLKYWLSDRRDQLAILTMSGVSYAYNTDGSARVGSQFPLLEFASDVTAPSTNRHFRWDGTSSTKALLAANTANVAATDLPSWKMLVAAKAKAINSMIRPISTENGILHYNVFMTPDGVAALKQDSDFLAVWKDSRERGVGNPLTKGTPHGGTNGIYVDGLNILEYRHVYNTRGAASGSKWGGGTVDGQRVLFCGAQALGYADIGAPKWVEKRFDYDNSPGIATAKILGFKKPVFKSQVTGTDEDFGMFCIDTAI